MGFTADDLYRELIARLAARPPEGAFTVKQLSEDAGCTDDEARAEIRRLMKAGKLEMMVYKRENWYSWKVTA